MKLSIDASLAFSTDHPVDCLLQWEVAATPEQRIAKGVTTLPASVPVHRVAAQDGLGERFWLTAKGEVKMRYQAEVDVERPATDFDALHKAAMTDLPAETTQYLFDSRFCAAETFQTFVTDEFGHLSGGTRVKAMRDWIADHFTYAAGSSGPATTAHDSFVSRRGVCRDFAHVMTALARASGMPARYVSCYAPEVTPQDFHAVTEVWLADGEGRGGWILVDATGMADPRETAAIGIGRDAADVSFLTSFGAVEFGGHEVAVTRL